MKILRIMKKMAGILVRWGYKLTYKLIPVDPRLVIFISFHGRGYSDNPRAIYEQMRQDPAFRGYRFVWCIKHHKKKNLHIPGAKIVEYFSIPYFYYLSRAKYWVINCKMPMYISKKPNQVYLQTWHGTPLKHLGHDIEAAPDMTFYRSGLNYEQMCHTYDVDSARYNGMIAPNKFCMQVFPHAFHVEPDKLLETGYPRNDFLSNYTNKDIKRIKEKYSIPENKKVILYAPTWRDDSYKAGGYTFKLQADFRKWKEKLGPDTVVLFKPHYLIVNEFKDDPQLQDFLISVPADADIRDLYVVSDAMVTDYSSVFFDYGILRRPVYFYMYDLDTYASDLRGFYIDIHKDLPGDIYEKEEDLLEAIHQNKFDASRYDAFNALYNNKEDGKASERVVNWLAEQR